MCILGQPGTGKTTLLNCWLGRAHFSARYTSDPVTLAPEYADVKDTRLWNAPGLLNRGADRAAAHREWLADLIRTAPLLGLVYVIKPQGGRVRLEDVELLRALREIRPRIQLAIWGPISASWTAKATALLRRETGVEWPVAGTVLAVPSIDGALDFSSPQARANAAWLQSVECSPRHAPDSFRAAEWGAEAIHRMRAERDALLASAHELERWARDTTLQTAEAEREAALVLANQAREWQARTDAEWARLQGLLAQERQEQVAHEQEAMSNVQKHNADMVQQHEAFVAEVAHRIRKARKWYRQAGAVLKHIKRKPLTLAPLVASVVLVPALAPAIATTCGVGIVPATCLAGAAVGGTSSALTHQPVLHGMAGGLTAGLGPLSESFSIAQQMAVHGAGQAAVAAVTHQNVLVSAAGGAALAGVAPTTLPTTIATKAAIAGAQAAVLRAPVATAVTSSVVGSAVGHLARTAASRSVSASNEEVKMETIAQTRPVHAPALHPTRAPAHAPVVSVRDAPTTIPAHSPAASMTTPAPSDSLQPLTLPLPTNTVAPDSSASTGSQDKVFIGHGGRECTRKDIVTDSYLHKEMQHGLPPAWYFRLLEIEPPHSAAFLPCAIENLQGEKGKAPWPEPTKEQTFVADFLDTLQFLKPNTTGDL